MDLYNSSAPVAAIRTTFTKMYKCFTGWSFYVSLANIKTHALVCMKDTSAHFKHNVLSE